MLCMRCARAKMQNVKLLKTNNSTFLLCRGDRIRTCDHLVPNQERYRTALHPASKDESCLAYG